MSSFTRKTGDVARFEPVSKCGDVDAFGRPSRASDTSSVAETKCVGADAFRRRPEERAAPPVLPPIRTWLMGRLFRAGLRASDAPELVVAELEARLDARRCAKDSGIPDPAGSGLKRDGGAL